VLCQLSYAPRFEAPIVLAVRSSLRAVQRRALGILFAVLALGFFGIAVAAAGAGVWVIVVAATALGLWLAGLSAKALGLR
jgi:hypothetical protein